MDEEFARLDERVKMLEADMAESKQDRSKLKTNGEIKMGDLHAQISKRPTTATLLTLVSIVWGVTSFGIAYFLNSQSVTIKELKFSDTTLAQKAETQYSLISEKLTSLCIQMARLESKVDQLDEHTRRGR